MGAAPQVRPGSPTVAEQRQLELVPGRKVWRVAELTAQVRELLERAFRDLWVQGEVSNFRVSPYGHYYFTLKDAAAPRAHHLAARRCRRRHDPHPAPAL